MCSLRTSLLFFFFLFGVLTAYRKYALLYALTIWLGIQGSSLWGSFTPPPIIVCISPIKFEFTGSDLQYGR